MNKVFPRYANKSLEDFQVIDPSHEEALRKVKTYMEAIREARADGYGLTFLGPAGVGKTYLACMVMKYAKEENFRIECIEADTFIDLHHQRMILEEDDARSTYLHIQRVARQADFVLMDDIGREHTGDSGWANHIIFNTLRFRYNRRLPFLITSNLSLDGLTERYSQGLVSVLHEVTEFIVIEDEDFRCRKAN